jgi:hypothetical protein
MGTSENAVRTLIATALIAYLLIRLAQAKLAAAHQAAIILTVVRGQLFTRNPLADLLDPPPLQRPTPTRQLSLFATRPKRTSALGRKTKTVPDSSDAVETSH